MSNEISAKLEQGMVKEIEENQPIEAEFKPQKEHKPSLDPFDALMDGVNKLDQENEKLKQNIENVAQNNTIPTIFDDGEDGDITELLDELDDDKTKKEMNMTDDDDIEALILKMEEEKIFIDLEETDDVTGPADYEIIQNDDYADSIEEVYDSNNIKIVKKSAGERNAILDKFTNTGPEVSMILVNSGIFVKSSGVGASEIIAMNQMESNSIAMVELGKLKHVAQHITGSSIGRISLKQLLKIISHYDKDTLYYALYAATYPDSELSRVCQRCEYEYYMKIKAKDLLLNPDEFVKRAEYIKYNVKTFEDLIKTSELGKIYTKDHSSGMKIYYKHPSIESYISTIKDLKPQIINKYQHIVDMVYGIEKIAIRDKKNDYIAYSDPNEIAMIISKLKSVSEKYEILDMLQEVRPNSIPVYGFKESKCPRCDNLNPRQPFSMDQLLFFKAQKEEETAALRWAAKIQKQNKEKSKKK